MFTYPHWSVLILDDEPDMLAITKLALRDKTVFDVPLKLYTAPSAKAGIELLKSTPELRTTLFACVVDVVMEADDAGLQFCTYVRQEMKNYSIQLILRTGQPGNQSQLEVIDKHGISNYVTKAEATQDRLYLTIAAGIQSCFLLRQHLRGATAFTTAQNLAKSPKEIPDHYFEFMREVLPYQKYNAAWELGDRYFGFGAFENKADYDKVKADILPRAAEQLATNKAIRNIPNPCATVDDYVIVETNVPGRDVRARLVLKNPTCPRGLLNQYAIAWRHDLLTLALAATG